MTNRCSNACTFCVRTTSDEYSPYSLWLKQEPSYDEIIDALQEYLPLCDEFVFCGYGEPLYRIDMVREVGLYLKQHKKYVRLNTNGQADLIVGKNAAQQLSGAVDIVSVSLNEVTPEDYQTLCRCRFGEDGFRSMLDFAADCRKLGLPVTMSVVDVIGQQKCQRAKEIAEKIGAELRVRPLIK